MTINDYFNSNYFTSLSLDQQFNINHMLESDEFEKIVVKKELFSCLDDLVRPNPDDYLDMNAFGQAEDEYNEAVDSCYNRYGKEINPNEKIISKDEGAYMFNNTEGCAPIG